MTLEHFWSRAISVLMSRITISVLTSRIMQVCIFLKLRWRVLNGRVTIGDHAGGESGSPWIDIEFEPDSVAVKVGTGGGHVLYRQYVDRDVQTRDRIE